MFHWDPQTTIHIILHTMGQQWKLSAYENPWGCCKAVDQWAEGGSGRRRRRHDRYRDAKSKKSKSLFHDQKRFEGRNSFRLFMNHRYKDVVVNFATVNYEQCLFYPMFLSLRFISVSPGCGIYNKRNDLEQRNNFFPFPFSFYHYFVTTNPLNQLKSSLAVSNLDPTWKLRIFWKLELSMYLRRNVL